jgi:hypothetical protein
VGLPVEYEALLVDVAVEVDGELRHPRDRLVNVDEGRRAVGHHEPAGDAEVAVEPAVEEHASVDLDAELAPARPLDVRSGFEPQSGGVGVRADDPERERAALPGAAPGDEGAAADRVAPGLPATPGLPLVDEAEAGRVEGRRRCAHRVPWGRRGVEIGQELGDGIVWSIGRPFHQSTR